KYLSDIQTDIKRPKDQMIALLIILVPTFLIVPQPDPGSALVFFSLIFVIFREGLPLYYLGLGFLAILIFVLTLIFGTVWVLIGLGLLLTLFFLLKKPSFKVPLIPISLICIVITLYSLSVNFVYETVCEQRHR